MDGSCCILTMHRKGLDMFKIHASDANNYARSKGIMAFAHCDVERSGLETIHGYAVAFKYSGEILVYTVPRFIYHLDTES